MSKVANSYATTVPMTYSIGTVLTNTVGNIAYYRLYGSMMGFVQVAGFLAGHGAAAWSADGGWCNHSYVTPDFMHRWICMHIVYLVLHQTFCPSWLQVFTRLVSGGILRLLWYVQRSTCELLFGGTAEAQRDPALLVPCCCLNTSARLSVQPRRRAQGKG
jgi:hypothetical protein